MVRDAHVFAGMRDYVPGLRATIEPAERGILLWCRIGRADVTVGDVRFTTRERDAVWVPAGFAVTVTSAPGTVVVPIMAHRQTTQQAPGAPIAVAVPAQWQPALLTAYARSLGFLHSTTDEADIIAPLLVAGRARHLEVPLPGAAGLRAIAEDVVARPGAATSIEDHAATLDWTVRTFQRRFHAETGLTFREWRRRARVHAGLHALAGGITVAEAAEAAGFASPSAFCRSVRELTGDTPRATVALAVPRAAPAAGVPDEALAAPPELRAARTVQRVTPFEIALWAARGGGTVTVDGVARRLQTGDVALLPAHRPHEIVVDPDSVLLPVASRTGRRHPASSSVRIAPSPHRLRAVLLHSSVVSYTPLRSPGFAPDGLLDALLHGEDAGSHAQTSSAALVARLTHGARLLRAGHSVAQTAGALGYAHPSAFSRVFRAHYGLPPSRFRDQAISEGTSATLTWMMPASSSATPATRQEER